jgi:uncharacterized membrane protein
MQNILSYDFHPIMVHIPIAFLTVYTLLEITTAFVKKWNTKTTLYIKLFLLVVGVLGAGLSLSTGELAADLQGDSISRKILHAHEGWAEFTSQFFWVVFAVYCTLVCKNESSIQRKFEVWFKNNKYISYFFRLLSKIGGFIERNRWILVILALVGLLAVSVTGALGGALVYGADADPFVVVVLKALGL